MYLDMEIVRISMEMLRDEPCAKDKRRGEVQCTSEVSLWGSREEAARPGLYLCGFPPMKDRREMKAH